MLVISRRVGEKIFIDRDIVLIVSRIDVRNGKVYLAFDAPLEVRITREEVYNYA